MRRNDEERDDGDEVGDADALLLPFAVLDVLKSDSRCCCCLRFERDAIDGISRGEAGSDAGAVTATRPQVSS